MISYFPKNFSTTIRVKLSGFRQFLGGVEAFSLLNLLLLMIGGLLKLGVSALLVVVMVQTLVISLFLAISSSLSHIACNSAIILTFSSILTWMAFKVLLS